MNEEFAHDVLGTKPGDAPEYLARCHQKRRADLEKQARDAPTPRLRDKRLGEIEQVDEAYRILGGKQGLGAETLQQRVNEKPRAVSPYPEVGGEAGRGELRTGGGLRMPRVRQWIAQMPPWVPSALAVGGVAILLIVVISISSKGGSPGAQGTSEHAVLHGERNVNPGDQKPKAATAEDAIKAGFDRMSAGETDAAIKAFRAAIEMDPKNAVAAAQLDKLLSASGHIRVTTRPPGALVEVVAAGKQRTGILEKATPASFDHLPFGNYLVHVRMPGYEEVQPLAVQVKGTAPLELPVELKRQVGVLSLSSDPAGLDFRAQLVESLEVVERKGKTNVELTGLPTGKYLVEFSGGQKRDVTITPGGKVEVALVGTGGPTAPKSPSGGVGTGSGASPVDGAPSSTVNLSVTTPTPVKVTTAKPLYHAGEAVVCSVEIPYDGHLRLYNVDAQGNRSRIFPNFFEKNDRVQKGQIVKIPGNDSYDLKLELPAGLTKGTESVHAVMSPTPFTNDDNQASLNEKTPFQSLGTGSVSEFKTRGLTPQQKSDSGSVSYEVTE